MGSVRWSRELIEVLCLPAFPYYGGKGRRMRKLRFIGTALLGIAILLIVTVVVLVMLEPTPWVCRSDRPWTEQMACY